MNRRHEYHGEHSRTPALTCGLIQRGYFGTDVVFGYHHWTARLDELGTEDVRLIRGHAAAAGLEIPLVVIRFDSRSEIYLEASVKRLRSQILEEWRAELYFDSSCSAQTVALAQSYAVGDCRLAVRTTSVEAELPIGCDNVRSALFLCGGVLIREHALYMFALAAANHEMAVVYSDEDRCDRDGERFAPIFKPVFSPELFENRNYLGSCVLLRAPTEYLKVRVANFACKYQDVGAMVDDVVPGMDPRNVIHVSHILFHDSIDRQPRALLKERHSLGDPLPSVSIIVPTKDRVNFLRPCLESIQRKTEYPRDKFEIVVIDNGSSEEKALQYLSASASSKAIRLERDPEIFNFSGMNNRAAKQCRNDVLVFLNNDTVVIDPLWLHRLVDFAMRDDVAAVGAKLLYPDGSVQHGGIVLGVHCYAVHSHVGILQHDPGFQGLANITREVAAVTAACMAIRRDLFEELGGFDERLAITFNDTDLCLRALKSGYRNICISDALVVHHESKTRGLDDTPEKIATARREAEITRARHANFFRCDPYYNPNLSVDRLYELAFPPRRIKPWRDYARRDGKLRILLLSLPHEPTHRVSRIMSMLADDLVMLGHEVFIGGPKGDSEPAHAGCHRIEVGLAESATSFAVESDIDCVMAHEPPFFSVARWTGHWPKVICCDHDELPREIFDDERERMELETRLSFSAAHAVIRGGSMSNATEPLELLAELKAAIEELCFAPEGCVRVDSAVQDRPLKVESGHIGPLCERNNAPGARAAHLNGPDRREFCAKLRGLNGSELVDRAYLAVLGRYADQSGRAQYIDQLSRGVPKDRIVWEIANSEEAKGRGVNASDVMAAAGLSYLDDGEVPGALSHEQGREWLPVPHVQRLLHLDGEEFVYSIYVTILGRLPDTGGLVHYLTKLQSGTGKLEIISDLRNSPEGRRRRVPLTGYRRQLLRRRFGRLLGAATHG